LENRLQQTTSARVDLELRRLHLIDEIHASIATKAALRVDCDEALSASEALEQAAADKSASAWRYQDEATELRAEIEEHERLGTVRLAAAEERLEGALRGPEALRATLWEIEGEVAAAVSAESEANRAAEFLCEQLEDLHSTTTFRLQDRRTEVAAARRELSMVRGRQAEMVDACTIAALSARSEAPPPSAAVTSTLRRNYGPAELGTCWDDSVASTVGWEIRRVQ
jgi:chromosome segregation ATPase